MSEGSIWNPENIRDIAESTGISGLSQDVVDHLTRDVEFRIAQILEEALKFMRHAKRTTLFTQDISHALRVLDVEPLYGYDSTRPLRFGEASIGPGQPLFYVEDDEVDFEKLINAPLPKIPREITFTAHWLAVEGVQPSIPQNPTSADAMSRPSDLLPKGPGANPHLAATAGADNLTVKPLVRHIISKELQQYFDHVSAAILDENNEEYRAAALVSLQSDPGIHQLVPYFVQFVAEKVTHSLKSIFVLTQMLHLIAALLNNPHLHLAPYIAALVPPVLTCLVGKRLGPPTAPNSSPPASLPAHYQLRDLAASLMGTLTRKEFTETTPSLRPRLARTLLKHLLSTSQQPLGSYYGAILALDDIAGAEGVRSFILPNLALGLDEVLKEALEDGKATGSEELQAARRREVDAVIAAVFHGLEKLEAEMPAINGHGESDMDVDGGDAERQALTEKLGLVIGEKVIETGRKGLIQAVMSQ